ncbi:hypothetical protein PG984_015270 [Apiospora sp. TS-2023a]
MAQEYSRLSRESQRSVSISESDMEKLAYSPKKRWSGRFEGKSILWRAVQLLAGVGALLIFAYGGHWLYARFHPSGQDVPCNCGDSVAEARAMGCRFDPLAAAWLPAHCRDDELIEQFNHAGPGTDGAWSYYTDPEKTGVMNLEEVGGLGRIRRYVFADKYVEQHIQHCHYVWLKLHRMRTTRVRLAMRNDKVEHIMHCMKMARLRIPLESVTTGSGVSVHADADSEGRVVSDKQRFAAMRGGGGGSDHDAHDH